MFIDVNVLTHLCKDGDATLIEYWLGCVRTDHVGEVSLGLSGLHEVTGR